MWKAVRVWNPIFIHTRACSFTVFSQTLQPAAVKSIVWCRHWKMSLWHKIAKFRCIFVFSLIINCVLISFQISALLCHQRQRLETLRKVWCYNNNNNINIIVNRWDYWYDSYAVSLDISFQWLNWWRWNHTALQVMITVSHTGNIQWAAQTNESERRMSGKGNRNVWYQVSRCCKSNGKSNLCTTVLSSIHIWG